MSRGIIVAGLSVALLWAITSFILYLQIPKTATVDFGRLYDGFAMKTEYEKEFQAYQQSRMKVLDSMKFVLKDLSDRAQSQRNAEVVAQFERLRNEYLYRQESFDRETDEKLQDYKQKIIKQLKRYVKSYGDDKGYDYIYGVDEGYELLYKKENKDITNDVIPYVNEKYKGLH